MVTNDFAAVNAGQVKHIASNACEHLEAKLAGGAGTSVWNVVNAFSPTNNFLAVNLGQLKNLAAPFYDRLIAVGYTNAYPWTTNTADDADFAVANIGQVKCLFGFDLSDFDTDADDLDGDGLSNLEEQEAGGDPLDFDTDDDGVADGLDPNVDSALDSDTDNLPDDWETHWFGDLDETGAGDYDGDGTTNYEEFLAGTDPTRGDQADIANATGLEVFVPID